MRFTHSSNMKRRILRKYRLKRKNTGKQLNNVFEYKNGEPLPEYITRNYDVEEIPEKEISEKGIFGNPITVAELENQDKKDASSELKHTKQNAEQIANPYSQHLSSYRNGYSYLNYFGIPSVNERYKKTKETIEAEYRATMEKLHKQLQDVAFERSLRSSFDQIKQEEDMKPKEKVSRRNIFKDSVGKPVDDMYGEKSVEKQMPSYRAKDIYGRKVDEDEEIFINSKFFDGIDNMKISNEDKKNKAIPFIDTIEQSNIIVGFNPFDGPLSGLPDIEF